jgi:putative membrane protein
MCYRDSWISGNETRDCLKEYIMHSLFTYWHLDGFMVILLLFICFGYINLTGFKIVKKSGYFITGLILVILSIASPLHFLGENYLMSAHMLSHVILLLIASPLLVAGIPDNIENRFLIRFSVMLSKYPWLGWMAGVCIMWFWHVPIIFNRLFAGPYLNVLQNIHLISLMVAGILFSWPVFGPFKSYRMAPLNAVLYLSAACIFCSVLGLMITFAPMGIYTPYIHPEDRFGFLNMIRNNNGISAVADQQMAGLIMWVPGCLIYLSASIFLLMKWFREKNEQPVFANPDNNV